MALPERLQTEAHAHTLAQFARREAIALEIVNSDDPNHPHADVKELQRAELASIRSDREKYLAEWKAKSAL